MPSEKFDLEAYESQKLRKDDEYSDDVDDEEEMEREKWSNGFEYLLSLIGYCVGVGNLWRFPYLCLRNGGGAFLIPFAFFLLVCGLPLYYMEVCLGQFSGISSMLVWRMCPLFQGIGYGMVLVSGIACIYYNAVIGWSLYYLYNSFSSTLPWTQCGQWWNTDRCTTRQFDEDDSNSTTTAVDTVASGLMNSSLLDQNAENMTSYMFNTTSCAGNATAGCRSSAQEFWQFNVLRMSSGLHELGGVQYHSALCILLAWVVVCLALIRGVKSMGKVVYVTALLPYLLLTIFLVRGLMLPGAFDGIKLYLKPDISKLLNIKVWVEASIQVFFSLGPAWGPVITMSSFNKFKYPCVRQSIAAAFADGLTSFYAGFVIFSVIGFISLKTNVSIDVIASQGPGLALVAYPEAISTLPFPQLWAVLFFLMLFMLGLDSQFGMFETVICGLIDAFPAKLRRRRIMLTFGLAALSFAIALPISTRGGIYIFSLLDWYSASFFPMSCIIIECIVVAWIYGIDRFTDDIVLMLGYKPNIVVRVSWAVTIPIIMSTIFVFSCAQYSLPVYDTYVFPLSANVIGFVIAFLPLAPIPIGMVHSIVSQKSGSFSERFMNAIRPASNWSPAPRKLATMYAAREQSYLERPHWFIRLTSKLLRRQKH